MHSDAVIVWMVDQYDSGKEDIIIMLKCSSDNVEPIFVRLSDCCIMVGKCSFSLLR